MLLRYDFLGDKLDLSRFKKQSAHYIGTMRQLEYHFYFKDYKLKVDIATSDDSNAHSVSIQLFEFMKNGNFVIQAGVLPANDFRFKYLLDLFEENAYEGYFESNSVSQTVDKLSYLITVVYKINDLQAFI